jgi:hypothetical protein
VANLIERGAGMDGKGWKPQYGISSEGIELLGYVEALPLDARRELVHAVAELCRREGYLSLHDDLRTAVDRARQPVAAPAQATNVIPLFRDRQGG